MEQLMQNQVNILDRKQPVDDSMMMEKVMQLHASTFNALDTKDSKDSKNSDWYMDSADNIPSEWKDFIPKWQRSIRKAVKEEVLKDDPILSIAAVMETIKKENGMESVVLNMTQKCDYTDAFVFTQGNNSRHVNAIAEAVKKLAKSKIPTDSSLPSQISMTDAKGQDWIIVDMGKFILHVFTKQVRDYYDLEGLWTFVLDPMRGDKIRDDRMAHDILTSIGKDNE